MDVDSYLLISKNLEKSFQEIFDLYTTNQIYVLVDENTQKHCLPIIQNIGRMKEAKVIEIKSGEENKSIKTSEKVWKFLSENGADRNSLMINLGGGMICDLGGMVASTFKRGIDFINIPTTLLAQVDASVGGKLAVNFNGLKNQIGLFRSPKIVLIDTIFLKTIDKRNFLSGFAEMLKHGLVYNFEHFVDLQNFDLQNINYISLIDLIKKSIEIKDHFVKTDPCEKNIRKVLNFGHTFAHAFESFSMQKSLLYHGEAVAIGLICELFLSYKKLNFPKDKFENIVKYLIGNYPSIKYSEENFDELYELMQHDKKNSKQEINFSLLENIGEPIINQISNKEEIFNALKFYLSLNN